MTHDINALDPDFDFAFWTDKNGTILDEAPTYKDRSGAGKFYALTVEDQIQLRERGSMHDTCKMLDSFDHFPSDNERFTYRNQYKPCEVKAMSHMELLENYLRAELAQLDSNQNEMKWGELNRESLIRELLRRMSN